MVSTWPRASYVVGGGRAEVALIALSPVKLPDPLPVSRARHGMPSDGDGPGAVSLAARDRGADPAWFADAVLAPFADMILQDLGATAAATALAARHACVITAELDDPDDLGYLQAVWAIAKCVCEQGAVVVLDVYAARAHLGADIAALEVDRAFDVMHEVTLFFDEQPDGTVAAWTLGLRKLGRPDLVLAGIAADSPNATTDAALALRDAAAVLAAGELLAPGDQLGPFTVRALDRARDPAFARAIDNDVLVLLRAG